MKLKKATKDQQLKFWKTACNICEKDKNQIMEVSKKLALEIIRLKEKIKK
jgi:hypothetical protein